MERNEALNVIKGRISNKNLQKHCLAVEAVMRALAERFGEDKEKWGLAGLLHDIDYEETQGDPASHSLVGSEILEQWGLPEDIVYAVKVHNDYHGLPKTSLMDKALFATDPLTGLAAAAALITTEKKLHAVDVEFLLNRYKEKSFARGARRESIESCSEVGLDLEEFMEIGLNAMKSINKDIGL